MTRTVRKYTKEFKQEAVNLALKSPSISKAAESLGIPMPTLHSWITQMKTTSKTAIINSDSSNDNDIAVLLEENRRLHKELMIVKEEKEILKKAATYFAQHQK